MARAGLYKSDIQKARDIVMAQGKNPSVDAVRVALGNTGSKTTIHRYLKELEAEEGGSVGAKLAISDTLQDLVGRLSARLQEEADVRIQETQTRFDAQRRDDLATLERQKQDIMGLSAQLQRTEVALHTEQEQHTSTRQALQESRIAASQLDERVLGLTARLSEHEAHVSSLEQKHQQAREALEHFRTSAKEQRDQEQRRHEHQVQGLQVELRQAAEALTGKNHELMQLNRDNARMTEQLGQQGKELRQAQHDQRLLTQQRDELNGIASQFHALETQHAQALLTNEQLSEQLVTAQQDAHREREARQGSDAKVVGLKARLQALEDMFAQLRMTSSAPKASAN
ncbi:MAG: DNA-binding protein [Arenimonas sp.]